MGGETAQDDVPRQLLIGVCLNVVMVIDRVNGQGHVSRSTALREAMPPEWTVIDGGSAGALKHTPPDVIVVDDYRVDADLIAHWQDRCPVVVFDDGQFGEALEDALVIRGHGGNVVEVTRRRGIAMSLSGHDYCPIRKMSEVPVVDGVAVMLGGGPEALTMTMEIWQKLVTSVDKRPLWPSRPRLLVCAGGQTALEAAHLGVPSVIVKTADNQSANVNGLQDAGLARYFGTWEEATANPGALAECVREQLANEAWRKHVAAEGPKWIDGKGGERIVVHMRRLVHR